VLAIAAAVSACGWTKASKPDCTLDTGVRCTAGYCDLVRDACEKKARICVKPKGECDIEVCAQDAAEKLATTAHPADAARTLYECTTRPVSCTKKEDCTTRPMNCMEIEGCFSALAKSETCAKDSEERKSELKPLLPTRITLKSGDTAGVVVLPGDDLQCLQCAFEPGGCAESFPGCFSAVPETAGATNSCLDYRVCLRTCEQTSGDDALRHGACVAEYCDPSEAGGRKDFSGYRQCMVQHCSSCFVPKSQGR
jgi:hypothetical protein